MCYMVFKNADLQKWVHVKTKQVKSVLFCLIQLELGYWIYTTFVKYVLAE